MIRVYLAFLFSILFSVSASAAQGLIIHASEIGVAKFHRMDHKARPHAADNLWSLYKLPEGANDVTPQFYKNQDGSVTIVFSSLEELLVAAADEAVRQGRQISVLNINGHGLPGGMWFPKDTRERDGTRCAEWRRNAYGDDGINYNQYYRAVSYDEIMQLRSLSKYARARYSCVTGLNEWEEILGRISKVRSTFAEDAQVHLFSCLVGLGNAGSTFTLGIGSLLLSGKQPAVMSSLNFGLGDWSMPEGMGFWDFIDHNQLQRDNEIYVKNKRDRDIMQKGTVRVTTVINGAWVSGFAEKRDFLYAHWLHPSFDRGDRLSFLEESFDYEQLPKRVRIPGTDAFAERLH